MALTALPTLAQEKLINESVLSPKETYPLHIQVVKSNVEVVPKVDYSATTVCSTLFGLTVCDTSGEAVPGHKYTVLMVITVEETGETTTVWCHSNAFMRCTGLPVGRYAARFRMEGHELMVPLALIGLI